MKLHFNRSMENGASPEICIAANSTWYVYNFRSRLVSTLLAHGYRVSFLAPHDQWVEKMVALGARHIELSINSSGTNALSEGLTLARVFRLLQQQRPSILLTYTPKINIYCSLAARALGIPVIANISGLGYVFGRENSLTKLVRKLFRVALKTPRKVFFQNQEDLDLFLSLGIVQPERSERLPGSGVDVDRFRPRPKHHPTDRFVFLLVARLLWEKGVGEYVQAARRLRKVLPNTECRIVGRAGLSNPSSIPLSQVRDWSHEGVITYLGASEQIIEQYAEADCVVLPSYYREGVPRTLLEASSMAVPIITTDMPGCRDALEDGASGLLVRARDADDLFEKMHAMALLPRCERAKMGAAGRKRMTEQFNENLVLDRYLSEIAVALSN